MDNEGSSMAAVEGAYEQRRDTGVGEAGRCQSQDYVLWHI